MERQNGWAYADSVDSEAYTGVFATREEATEEGLASFADNDSIAVAEAVYPDPAMLITRMYDLSMDVVLEHLDERAYDDGWFSNDAPLFDVKGGKEEAQHAKQALEDALKVWAAAYLEPQAWTAKNAETIMREDTKPATSAT